MLKRITAQVFRYLWLAFALLVILYALAVVAARELLPVINRYQPQISDYLSDVTGMDFDIGSLSGLWQGARPLLELEDIVIHGRDGRTPAIHVDRLAAEIDLAGSLASVSPQWRELRAGEIRVRLLEDEAGRWTLGGHPLGLAGDGSGLEYLYRMLYHSRLLSIDRVVVELSFFAGADTSLYGQNLQVENLSGFHRTSAAIALTPEGENIATLVFEARGDPDNSSDFVGEGYVHLDRINLEGPLETLFAAWLPGLAERVGQVETELDLSFWFDWRDGALGNGRGHLRAAELPLPLLPDTPVLKDVSAQVSGWFTPGEDWGLGLGQLRGSWGGGDIEPLDLQLRQGVGRQWGNVNLAVSQVDLEVAARLLRNGGLLGERGNEVLDALQPTGRVRNLHLAANFGEQSPRFRVRANLADVALSPWLGAPAARGINGYLEAGLREGFVVIDSADGFAMHYHQAFADYMPFGHTTGKVAWQWLPEEQRVLVTSNRIRIDGDEGRGTAALHLDLPTERGGDPQMYLMVGLRDSHTRHLDRYVPQVLNDGLENWLGRAIGDGHIPEAGFVWRGSLKRQNREGRAIQVYARLRDGTIDYRTGWPRAEKVDAVLTVNNGEMDARITAGEISGEPFEQLGVTIRQRQGGPLLRVVGNVRSDVETSLGVLAASPLGDRLAAVTGLEAGGNVDIALDLRIPLSANRRGEDYRVAAQLRGATLAIPVAGLASAGMEGTGMEGTGKEGSGTEVSDISGVLLYNSSAGLHARELTASLWDEPVEVAIESTADDLRIQGGTTLGPAGLAALLGDRASLVEGQTPVAMDLRIALTKGNAHRLDLTSSLEGLRLQLPEPLGKEAATALPARVALDIGESGLVASAALEDRVLFSGVIENGVLRRGALSLLTDSALTPERDELLIRGRLPSVRWSDWQPVLAPGGAGSEPVAALPPVRLDLVLDELVVGDFSLGNTRVRGGGEGGGWLLDVTSPRLAGQVALAGDGSPPRLALDHLRLPRPAPDTEGATGLVADDGPLADLSPLAVPELDVDIRQLQYGDDVLGSLAFSSRRLEDGVMFTDIRGDITDILIKPQPLSAEEGDEDPAQLLWTLTESGHASFFSGTLEIDNIEEVMARWNLPPAFAGDRSTFFANLGWRGKPWQATTLILDGYLGIDLRDGRFNEATGVATNAFFKLVGLINFDTWLRRLRFDFSDFFSDGLSYDRVEGGLLFRQGMVDFDDPIVASMPGGRIRLDGTVDLIYEQLDAQLVATMPIGTNLPWVAGLLGGLPAAAGVFLTSKLFEKQVDQLSSIGYRVTGSLDDPKIEVDRIFTDPTRQSNSEQKSGE